MLTWEDQLEAHALRKRGWTITAIAARLARDRKTIRACLAEGGSPDPSTGSNDCSVP